jgi:hypothetical protein
MYSPIPMHFVDDLEAREGLLRLVVTHFDPDEAGEVHAVVVLDDDRTFLERPVDADEGVAQREDSSARSLRFSDSGTGSPGSRRS